MYFVSISQSQAICFLLFSVFVLLAAGSSVTFKDGRHESGMNLLIYLLARKQPSIFSPQMPFLKNKSGF